MAGKFQITINTRAFSRFAGIAPFELKQLSGGKRPINNAAAVLLAKVKQKLSQPGKGETYETEWRSKVLESGQVVVFPLWSEENNDWVWLPSPHVASKPYDPPAVGPPPGGGILRAGVGITPAREGRGEVAARVFVADKEAKVMSLELGSEVGSSLTERPFFRPAILESQRELASTIGETLRAETRVRGARIRKIVKRIFK